MLLQLADGDLYKSGEYAYSYAYTNVSDNLAYEQTMSIPQIMIFLFF